MPIPEKPANLSPGLLTPKDIPSPAGTEPTSADRPGAADERRPIDATAELKAQAAMLSPKGAASAAGFRPHYWSYDHAEAPPPPPPPSAPTAVVSLFPDTPPRATASLAAEPATPLPAQSAGLPVADPATSAPTSTPQPVPSRASPLIVVFGCIAIIASGSLYWLALSRPTTEPLRTASVGPPAEAAAPAPVRHDEPTPPRAVAPHPEAAAPSNTVRVVKAPPPPTVVAPADLVAAQAAAPTAPAAVASSDQAAVSALLPAEVGNLLARGDQLLATDDIAAARLFYQRAAELGSGPAATAVGKTYDPLFLEQAHARGIRGDAAIAAGWYRKASAAGDRQGQIRLERLLARFPE